MSEATKSPDVEQSALGSIPPEVWRIALVIVFGAFMAGLDTSLVNVGLETIGRQLHSSLTSVHWVTSGYLLALAGALPMCGWLGRYMGVGRLWLWALVGFTATSGLCALAPDLGALIAVRLAQGVCGGLLVPTGQTILGHPPVLALAVPDQRPRGRDRPDPRAACHPRGQARTAGRLDLTGLLLVSSGLPLLTYGIITASAGHSITGAPALTTIATGAAALGLFIWRSLHSAAPLLNLRVFGSRIYTAAETSVFFIGAAQFGGMIILPLCFELQRGKEWSAPASCCSPTAPVPPSPCAPVAGSPTGSAAASPASPASWSPWLPRSRSFFSAGTPA